MIVETIVDFFFASLSQAFLGLEIIGLPMQYINTLQTILVYGTWVVGADIMAIFVALIVGWWTIKMIVGAIIWIWELIPFT